MLQRLVSHRGPRASGILTHSASWRCAFDMHGSQADTDER